MLTNSYKFGFIGLGLIGGSILKALKKCYPDCTTVAASRSLAPLQEALADKNLDTITTSIDKENFGDCDYIFLCTPVKTISIYLEMLAPIINESCIITDVGSVKGCIHETVEKLNLEKNFIGGHPMAGSEKTGYANSSSTLLKNAFYAITPTSLTKKESLEEYADIVKNIGAIPIITDYTTHDYSVAGISHLPHIIASTLVNLIKASDNDEKLMKQLAAGGFKDITRIASSSPEMWEQICLSNSTAILSLLNDYINSLTDVKNALENMTEGYVYKMFESSKEYRDSLNKAQ